MTDSIQYLNTSMLLDVYSHLNLMFLLTDENFVIQFASPLLERHFDRPLTGRVLMDAMPVMAGIDQELQEIVFHRAEPWQIRGLQLAESGQNQFDVMIIPRSDETGLILAAWRIDLGASVEQVLRQQRNELALSFDKLSKQASALRTAKDRLASLDRERRALLNLIAHDIKSAVSVISGYSEWLSAVLALPSESESQKALNTIRESALGMTDLVKNVIVLERIERRLLQIDWQPLSLPKLVEDTIAMWRSVASTRDVRIETHVVGDLPEIEADNQLLQEAVQVLVKNMIEVAAAGAKVIIRLFTWDRWQVARFEQSLPKASGKQRIAPPMPHKATTSSDLQLALARLIVEGHGGHLSIGDGDPSGSGPAFSLWLLQRADQSDAEERVSSGTAPPLSDWRIVGQGDIRINTTSHQVWVGKKTIALTTSEYRLLLFLAEHTDKIVSHEEIAQAVWPHSDSDSIDKLRVLVWRLRQKLNSTGRVSQSIRTVRGFGYMLVS